MLTVNLKEEKIPVMTDFEINKIVKQLAPILQDFGITQIDVCPTIEFDNKKYSLIGIQEKDHWNILDVSNQNSLSCIECICQSIKNKEYLPSKDIRTKKAKEMLMEKENYIHSLAEMVDTLNFAEFNKMCQNFLDKNIIVRQLKGLFIKALDPKQSHYSCVEVFYMYDYMTKEYEKAFTEQEKGR